MHRGVYHVHKLFWIPFILSYIFTLWVDYRSFVVRISKIIFPKFQGHYLTALSCFGMYSFTLSLFFVITTYLVCLCSVDVFFIHFNWCVGSYFLQGEIISLCYFPSAFVVFFSWNGSCYLFWMFFFILPSNFTI